MLGRQIISAPSGKYHVPDNLEHRGETLKPSWGLERPGRVSDGTALAKAGEED